MAHKNNERTTLSDQEIDAILARFMHEALSVEEAEEAIVLLQTAHCRVVHKLLGMLRESVDVGKTGTVHPPDATHPPDHTYLVSETLGGYDSLLILLGYLGDSSTAEAILALVYDESIQDDLKLKLISLVIQLDPDADPDALFDSLDNPYEAMRRSQREHLERLKSPFEIAIWLEMMEEQMPPEIRVAFIRSIVELGDASAVPLLICLCYDPDDEVALRAIDAVERFKDARALPALGELAAYHPQKTVRDEASKAADRLRIRASLVPQVQSSPSMPLHACYLTTIDGSGGQVALIVRQSADEELSLANVMFNDHEGIKQCFGADLDMDEVEDMLDGLAEQGISPVQVPYEQCLAALDLAVETTWKAGKPLPTWFVAWRGVIEGDRTNPASSRPVEHVAEPIALTISPERRAELLSECYELLLQDEFSYWFFNPDEIGDLDDTYLDLIAATDRASEGSALRTLLRQGVREIVTDRMRGLLRGRLQRMAPLLRELYEDSEVWQWAVVAADALASDSPLPPDEHPLLLGMIAYSLENVLGKEINWLGVM